MPSERKGLSSTAVKELLQKFGPNILPEKPPPSALVIFLSQLKNPLVYVLLAAAVVTYILGHFSDTIIIGFAVGINTVLGFVQEYRASRALEALKKLIHPTTKVVRDGREQIIEVETLVPGDMVILETGSKIPADGKLLEVEKLFISEAILTGEADAVAKKKDEEIFMGTIVVAGRGQMEVVQTGATTKMGKIALRVQAPEEDTPLRKQLVKLSKQLALLVGILTTFVFVVGLLTGREILEMFTTSVALSVSAIPEGLLVGLTVVLALGMQRIVKRKGLVRNLLSAETLGSVSTICVDKTGTLTEGKMRVVQALGKPRALSEQIIVANDLDDPIVIAGYDWAKERFATQGIKAENLRSTYRRFDSLPFSSKTRFFASLNKWGRENMLFVNGAPEYLLEWTALSQSQKDQVKKQIQEQTQVGYRVMGLAQKKVSRDKDKLFERDVQEGLEWVGLLVFSDPVRPGVKDALEKTAAANVKTLVITGDYPETAISVMNQLGIKVTEKTSCLGQVLETTSATELAARLKGEERIQLFARTTPEQKLKIVEALEKNGEIVAMMGDGVNDAPALKKADIGIVVGEATDVAKETADLVLLDSSFATIIAAIEEGRGIFDNIRKIILYLMSDAFEEIVAVVGTLILGLPLPVTAVQILWINLISDGFPDLALTVDPKSPEIMTRFPRDPKESIINAWMRNLILIVSLSGGIMALALFVYFYHQVQDPVLARSIAFATLGVNSLVYVFSVRTLIQPFWQESPLDNPWLILAALVGLVFQVSPFFVLPLRNFLDLIPLHLIHWVLVFLAAGVMFLTIEFAKWLFRHTLKEGKK